MTRYTRRIALLISRAKLKTPIVHSANAHIESEDLDEDEATELKE